MFDGFANYPRNSLRLKQSGMNSLNPEKALIFRITHVANVPWILENGLHCRASTSCDPAFKNIGNPDLIEKRMRRPLPIPPGGTLGDYVPFYFTPFSIMLLNIKTGYGGVRKVGNSDIVILASSLRRVDEMAIPYVFTDRHAYTVAAEFFNRLDDLDRIDWPLLQARDFKHDPEDPGKKERYQAEALIHRYFPVAGLVGIVCFSEEVAQGLQRELELREMSLQIAVRPGWYF